MLFVFTKKNNYCLYSAFTDVESIALADSSGIIWATFRNSLLYVLGHCISCQEIGIIFIPLLSDLAIATPSSSSAVDNRNPDEASPKLITLARIISPGPND